MVEKSDRGDYLVLSKIIEGFASIFTYFCIIFPNKEGDPNNEYVGYVFPKIFEVLGKSDFGSSVDDGFD